MNLVVPTYVHIIFQISLTTWYCQNLHLQKHPVDNLVNGVRIMIHIAAQTAQHPDHTIYMWLMKYLSIWTIVYGLHAWKYHWIPYVYTNNTTTKGSWSHFTIIKKVSNCQKIKVSFPYVEIENYTRFYIGIKSTLVFPDMGNKIPLIVKQIICFVRRSQWQQPLLCQSG